MPIRNISDIEAIEAVPLAERRLPESTYSALSASAKRTPDARALSFFPTVSRFDRPFVWTYAQVIEDVTRAANFFHACGVTSESPVAFVLPNLPETHFTIWGGEAAGVVLAINPALEAQQIARLLRAARARVLVTLAPAPEANLWAKISGELSDLPDLRVVALVDPAAYLGGAEAESASGGEASAGSRSFAVVDLKSEMTRQPADRLVASRKIKPHDPSSYFCTGGTTGLPKIAMRTHGAEVFDAWAVSQVLEAEASQRTFFCGLPLFHVNAQLVTGLMAWMCGDHVVLGPSEGYRAKDLISRFWEIVSFYRVSMFSGVPTIYAALLEAPVGESDISSLRFAICGAAPMPAKLIEAFEQRTGVKILEGYGLTEGACVSSLNPPDGRRLAGSIGLRIPYQQMRAAILDDSGRFVCWAATDEVGVIAIRGPNVFLGYLEPQHNEALWIENDGERWLNTGDLGRQDSEGYFWLAGRKKELIIRGGHNIDPQVIEEALCRHPAVALAAAVGSPDAYAGEVPVAYVQAKPGATVSEQELLAFAAEHIPERAAAPRHVTLSQSLPTTAVGKLFKPALAQLEIERAIRAEAERVGATVADIRFDQGGPARIRATGAADALKAALDRYAFKSEVLEVK